MVAVLLASAAAVVGYYSVSAMGARAAAGTASQYRDVVVTANDLTFGAKLEADDAQNRPLPEGIDSRSAYASMDSVIGQTTKGLHGGREPVTATKLSSRGGGLSMLVRPSMRAASVEVNQVSGRLGVRASRRPRRRHHHRRFPGIEQNAVTRTLLQNIEVLAAGPEDPAAGQQAAVGPGGDPRWWSRRAPRSSPTRSTRVRSASCCAIPKTRGRRKCPRSRPARCSATAMTCRAAAAAVVPLGRVRAAASGPDPHHPQRRSQRNPAVRDTNH